MTNGNLSKIEEYVLTKLKSSKDTSHGWGHISRVRENALKIVNYLKINDMDLNLLQACCLLHDLCYTEFTTGSPYIYFFETKETVKILLRDRLDHLSFINEADWQIILEAVKVHSLSFPLRQLNKRRNYYCKILQDADTLDFYHE